MAVLKHIAIKNADYSAAVCYLKYQHDERHLKPLLDENGMHDATQRISHEWSKLQSRHL